jgi:MSHA biogenesis protein MshQ
MNFKSVWLIVLTMLMGSASAANVNFNGGSVGNCTLTGSTYSCSGSFAMGATDFAVIANGYKVVVTSFSPSYNQGLTINSGGVLQSSGNIDLSGINPSNVSTGGTTLTAAGSFKLGSSTTINGSVVAGSINTNSGDTITGSVTVSGLADLGSNIKINGSLTANAVTTDSPGTIGGAITATTTVDLGSHMTVGGNVSGTTITTTSPVSITGNVTATTSFTLASGSSVSGNISAPKVTLSPSGSTVTGTISAPTSLDIGSGNTVNGNVTGGSLVLRASNGVINGSVTMTGDVDLGSGTTINGDLKARDVTMHASSAAINGNAAVNSIYIDWGDVVTKTITCTGPGAVGCSCVTKANPSYNPTCGAPAPGVPHHFQITHNGSALTCQPQTVTLTACANAACTAPHFSGNVTATMTPGNQSVTVTSGSNSAATVQSSQKDVYKLSASNSSVTNSTICINNGTVINNDQCNMEFKTEGLIISATNHVSMTPASVTIEAKKADPPNQSCVPLLSKQKVKVNMTCSYKDPAPGAVVTKAAVTVGDGSMVCNKDTASVTMDFDVNGKASAALSYPEVGLVGLDANYSTSQFLATGSGYFYAAPDSLLLSATSPLGANAIGPAPLDSKAAQLNNPFAKAGQDIGVTVTALNAAGKTATNFGHETTHSDVVFVLDAVNPEGGGKNGNLPDPGASSITAAGLVNKINFSDVGVIQLGLKLAGDYYMNQQQESSFKIKKEKGLQYIGRIIPDHFETELVANTGKPPPANLGTMDCPSPSSNIYPCSGNASFTHSAQGFYIRVKAYNGAATPALTQNYAGTLAQPITLQAVQLADNTKPDTNGTIKWSKEGPPMPAPAPTRFTFTGGIGELDMSGAASANLPTYVFPPRVPLTVYLRAIDADNTTSLRATPSDSKEAVLTMVSGRLLVAKAYGSPTAPLPIGVTAQYLMPTGYVYNPLVNDTSVDAVSKHIVFSNCLKGMATYTCTLNLANSSAQLELTKGVGKFTLLAPKPALSKIGMIDVQLKDAAATPNELFPYLPSTTGTAIFGLYPSGPVIYTREIY